jgi:hypothetical protein
MRFCDTLYTTYVFTHYTFYEYIKERASYWGIGIIRGCPFPSS